jgi:hypothetical protein
MRVLLTTVRVLASLVYCLLGFIGFVVVLYIFWSLIAGTAPFAGVLAHGNVPLPPLSLLLWIAAAVAPLVDCDIYFRVTKRYTDSHDNAA